MLRLHGAGRRAIRLPNGGPKSNAHPLRERDRPAVEGQPLHTSAEESICEPSQPPAIRTPPSASKMAVWLVRA